MAEGGSGQVKGWDDHRHGPSKPAIQKQVVTVLKQQSQACLSSPPMTKDQTILQAEVFSPQAWVQSESHCFIGGTPFGIAEARWLMEGSYIIAGVKLEEVPGAHLNNKTEYVHGMQGIDDLLKKM